jgi:hypothetical protein
MIIEIDRKWLKEVYNGNIKQLMKAGDYLDWTPERIKRAFAFGNGTITDLHKYINNNRQYAIFYDTEKQRNI